MHFPTSTLTTNHKSNCACSSWLPIFKSVTLKTRIIPLPQEFIDYLLADGIFLPLDRNGLPQPSFEHSGQQDVDYEKMSDDEEDDVDPTHIPHFPELQELIETSIQELGGSVFPKLNWSSPKDASWMMMGGQLKCTMVADVFLLLKSSDFVTHDIMHAFDDFNQDSSLLSNDVSSRAIMLDHKKRPFQYELVLRKWYDLLPSMEFRCFVKNHQLVAISQRDDTHYYEFLTSLYQDIQSRITDFFHQSIQNKFMDAYYVFDVYINRSNQRVWLIDFNPFSPTTDALLFTWEELLDMEPLSSPVFRILETQGDADGRSMHQPAYALNRVPRDVIDMSTGATPIEYMQRVMSEMRVTLQSEEEED